MDLINRVKLDKTAFSVVSLSQNESDDEKFYWWSKTAEERLLAIELMRQINFDYNPLTTQLQRVLTVVEFPQS